ncbi:MAG: M23 family metallopeptidase [bacterium]|nr:M23 family metallopeptidase [bacterium]
MLNTHIVSGKSMGFALHPLNPKKEPHPMFFLGQKSSFWIATLSVMAFLIGNMMGQHGWHLFWASVLGQGDDSLIVYTGTVAPVAEVPNYSTWSQYGGDDTNSYRQVPKDVLMELPSYLASDLHSVYSVANMGSYAVDTEGAGSHPGVDIRMPEGTPILSIANGIVDRVKSDAGYGNVIVVRHPNVPDPESPGRRTTLYSVYAHLETTMVTEGSIVMKGEQIATSGSTGFASGPHLHFQIDRESAPWHPYWPFTSSEAREAGLSTTAAVNSGFHQSRLKAYTVNPMMYVQQHNAVVKRVSTFASAEVPAVPYVSSPEPVRSAASVIFSSSSSQRSISSFSSSSKITGSIRKTLALQIRDRRALRVSSRLQARRYTTTTSALRIPDPLPVFTQAVIGSQAVVSLSPESGLSPITLVTSVEIHHDGSYSGRGWEKITVTLKDADGNVATNPELNKDIYLRTDYGEAEFRPSMLTVIDFIQGSATVHMLPRGRRTIILKAQPFGEISAPMIYSKQH